MAQKVKLFQGILQETSQQPDGNGSSNTACLTPTGSRSSDTLKPTADSSSQSENQPGFQRDAISLMRRQKRERWELEHLGLDNLGNGTYTGIGGNTWSRLEEDYLERLF